MNRPDAPNLGRSAPAGNRHWPRHLPRSVSTLESTLYDNLAISAQRYPDKPALIFYGAVTTYSQLLLQVNALAGCLEAQLGVQPGDRVGLFMQNCPQFVVAYFAVQRIRAIVVPVNVMYRRAELLHVKQETGARVAVAGSERIEELIEIGYLPQSVIAVDYGDALAEADLDMVPESIVEPPRRHPNVVHWAEALSAGNVPRTRTPHPDELCLILYSSGTTSRPKGCVYTQKALSNRAAEISIWSELYASSVILMPLPMFHVAGIQPLLNAPVFAGAAIVISARWNPHAACLLTERYGVTHWHMVPAMLVDVLGSERLDQYDLSSVRRINAGGAALPGGLSDAIERRWGLPFIEGYGMSETCGAVLSNPPQHAKSQCLGIPLFEVDARVVDPETLQLVPQGETGEIVVWSPHLFHSYWGDADATREAFTEIDGRRYLRTGDIGKVDEEGYFCMVDRLKRMINASAYKVSPAEVEALLMAHPAVREVCVIGKADTRRGETVKALLVLKDEQREHVDAEQIIDWARERIAAYKCPRYIDIVDELPRLATGKIDWRRVQDAEHSTHSRQPGGIV